MLNKNEEFETISDGDLKKTISKTYVLATNFTADVDKIANAIERMESSLNSSNINESNKILEDMVRELLDIVKQNSKKEVDIIRLIAKMSEELAMKIDEGNKVYHIDILNQNAKMAAEKGYRGADFERYIGYSGLTKSEQVGTLKEDGKEIGFYTTAKTYDDIMADFEKWAWDKWGKGVK